MQSYSSSSSENLSYFHPGIFPSSWLSYVLRGAPVGAINPDLMYQTSRDEQPFPVTLVSVDIGNDAIKLGLLDAGRRFVTLRIPATYRLAPKLRAGGGPTSWQVEGESETYWIDAPEGESLQTGPTWQRLADRRYRRFVYAALVEALIAAGYRAGSYRLVLGIGVRNEEIERDPETDKESLEERTKQALFTTLREHPFTLKQGTPADAPRWHIEVAALVPAAQTFGTFFAWFYDLGGTPVESPIRQVSVLDYGGGDTHLLNVDIHPGKHHVVTGEWVGNGTMDIARAFADEVRASFDIPLTLAEAQAALVSGTILKDGRDYPIGKILSPIKAARIDDMLGRAVPALRNPKRYSLHSGGGAALMAGEIGERMAALGRDRQSYLVLPKEVASLSNVVGLYAMAYYRVFAMYLSFLKQTGRNY